MRERLMTMPSLTGSAPPLKAGAGAASDEGDAFAMAEAEDGLDLLGGGGEEDGVGHGRGNWLGRRIRRCAVLRGKR